MSGELDWVDELAVEAANEHTLGGLAVGVVRDGALAHATCLGLADADAGRAVDQDTMFRIGSVSKTFTAAAVLQLRDRGLLALDDPVNDHLRAFRIEHRDPETPPATIRHLLTHTGGLGELRALRDATKRVAGLGRKVGEPLPALAEVYAPLLRAEVAPGTKWAYANHGYAALGQLVEDVSGTPFPEYAREHLFGPLGMERSDFRRTEAVRERLAVGYERKRGRLRPVRDLEIVVGPAGSVFSSLAELARWAAAVAAGGPPVLAPETLAEMLEPQWQLDPRLPSMGLGFFVVPEDGRRVAGHGGGWPGFVSSFLVAPDDGVGVLALTNTSTGLGVELLARRILRRLLGLPESPEAPLVAEQPHLWPELTGIYRPPRGLNTNARPLQLAPELEVTVRGGHLTLRAPSPVRALRRGVRLRALDSDDPLLFAGSEGGVTVPVRFERGPSGEVEALAAGSPWGFVRMTRRPGARGARFWARAAAGGAGAAAAVSLVRRRRRSRDG